MSFLDLLLIAVGLSMDAFAVSICKGLGMRKVNYRHALIIALFFGGFQALMPAIGWALGSQFAGFVTSFAHWIAFALLAVIGGKMLWDAFHEEGEDVQTAVDPKLDFRELLMLAIATSIDALAVGVSFAFMQVELVPSITTIGITTFVISLGGVVIGNKFGERYQKSATIAGGIILVLIGIKIVVEHYLGG
ncbi:MAG: manganese efflux pump MntP family protein [Coriobacteriia bacterium]|nr:manganese efflux pump MntP family protein [Coriobacteriia bacterium]